MISTLKIYAPLPLFFCTALWSADLSYKKENKTTATIDGITFTVYGDRDISIRQANKNQNGAYIDIPADGCVLELKLKNMRDKKLTISTQARLINVIDQAPDNVTVKFDTTASVYVQGNLLQNSILQKQAQDQPKRHYFTTKTIIGGGIIFAAACYALYAYAKNKSGFSC